MVRPWPFVSRACELDAAQRALAGPASGVVIVGEAGVGKTRLAAELARRLDVMTHHTVRVNASAASSGIPFGALSHLLPSDSPDITRPANVLGWARQALLADSGDRHTVLWVDDAHMLDTSSAAVVDNLVRSRQAALLATVRSGEDVSDAVGGLWKDELVSRLELAPLGEDGVSEVLSAAMGEPVSPMVVRRLSRLSAGNPLYLRELVGVGDEEGALHRVDGIWEWAGDRHIAPRLRELIEARIGKLDDTARETIELVAFGEPIGIDLLAEVSSESAVELLESKHLIRVVADGRRLSAWLSHPLYGEIVRAGCLASRSRRRLRQLADAVESTGARRREDAVRVSLWRLDAGVHPEPAPLITACHLAWASQDLRLAMRFARAALDAGGGSEAAAVLSLLLNTIEDYDEAETIASAGPQPIGERGHALHATARATNLAWGLGREEDALRMLERAAPQVRSRMWRQQLMVARAAVGLLRGDTESALRLIEQLRALGSPRHRVAAEAAVVESFALTHSGQTDRGADAAAAQLATADAWREQAPHAEVALYLSQFLAHVLAGEVLLAERLATTAHEAAVAAGGWDMAIALYGGLRGQASRLQGKPITGMQWCRQSRSWLSDKGVVTGFCLAELSLCASYAGEPTTARDSLEQARQRTPRVARMLDITNKIAGPWVLAAEGDVVAATSGLLKLARWMRRHKLPANETQVLHDVVRIGGAAQAAARLAQLADIVAGDFPRLAAQHASGCLAGEGEALEKVADGFAEIGMVLFAAEAAAHATQAYHSAGQPQPAKAAAARAWVFVGRCESAATPALRALRAPDLTPREWEIALLAARDLTSRQVADRLVLSPRTVENHLSRIYRKLGVNNRADLKAVLGEPTAN